MDERSGPVIGVVGGSGGVGASSFAGALAVVAGAVLVDVDPGGGGIDAVLGIEAVPGARWSGLRLAGGRLDADALRDGLPRFGPAAVLAADVDALEPAGVEQVLGCAAVAGPVVVDLARSSSPARSVALAACDLAVVVARADVGGLVAAHATVGGLGQTPLGVVVRRGEVPAPEAARLVGAPLLGRLAPLTRRGVPGDARRLPRATLRVCAGVLSGFGRAAAVAS